MEEYNTNNSSYAEFKARIEHQIKETLKENQPNSNEESIDNQTEEKIKELPQIVEPTPADDIDTFEDYLEESQTTTKPETTTKTDTDADIETTTDTEKVVEAKTTAETNNPSTKQSSALELLRNLRKKNNKPTPQQENNATNTVNDVENINNQIKETEEELPPIIEQPQTISKREISFKCGGIPINNIVLQKEIQEIPDDKQFISQAIEQFKSYCDMCYMHGSHTYGENYFKNMPFDFDVIINGKIVAHSEYKNGTLTNTHPDETSLDDYTI